MFTAIFREAGRNALMLPAQVKADRFDETVRGLVALANLDGIIITVPYKARILPLVDRLLPTGERVGAINAMRRDPDGRWTGNMFDGKGMVGGMRLNGLEPRGLRVMLLGAGGAGSAIADALGDSGAASLTIFDVDGAKARALAERVGEAHPKCEVRADAPTLEDIDLLVNATPVGMRPEDDLPAELGPLDRHMIVFDVIVGSQGTALLRKAKAAGCRHLGGLEMMKGQAREVARFFGVEVKP
jgi:shikimate dehydrogenase